VPTYEVWEGIPGELIGSIVVSGDRVVAVDPPERAFFDGFRAEAVVFGAAGAMTVCGDEFRFVRRDTGGIFCEVLDTLQERVVGTIGVDGTLDADRADMSGDWELQLLHEELQRDGLTEASTTVWPRGGSCSADRTAKSSFPKNRPTTLCLRTVRAKRSRKVP
jgi:hypothetical protein